MTREQLIVILLQTHHMELNKDSFNVYFIRKAESDFQFLILHQCLGDVSVFSVRWVRIQDPVLAFIIDRIGNISFYIIIVLNLILINHG